MCEGVEGGGWGGGVEALSPGTKDKVALTLLKASVKCHRFLETCSVSPSFFPRHHQELLAHTALLTLGGLCLSPYYTVTDATLGTFNTWMETLHEITGDQGQQK